jgi:integrase/recombinase XerD
MEQAVDFPGAAHLVLVDGVAHLDPTSAVFEAMLDGWRSSSGPGF